jgi:hypothetical protein
MRSEFELYGAQLTLRTVLETRMTVFLADVNCECGKNRVVSV